MKYISLLTILFITFMQNVQLISSSTVVVTDNSIEFLSEDQVTNRVQVVDGSLEMDGMDVVTVIQTLIDTVELLQNKTDILETEKLNWNKQKEEIFTDEFVKITTDNEVIFGQGLVSNQNFSKYTIRKLPMSKL